MTTKHNAAVAGDLAGPQRVSLRETSVRKANVRMGLILASIALAFFVGFVVKMVLLSRPT